MADSTVKLILTEQLIKELKLVTTRPKFKKYFDRHDVGDFLNLISAIGLMYQIQDIPDNCRDSKDNFLLGLCSVGSADFLVTGDNDLLELMEYQGTRIINPSEFEKLI